MVVMQRLPEQVVIRMSSEMRAALTAEADQNDRTEAQIVRLALRDYLDDRTLPV